MATDATRIGTIAVIEIAVGVIGAGEMMTTIVDAIVVTATAIPELAYSAASSVIRTTDIPIAITMATAAGTRKSVAKHGSATRRLSEGLIVIRTGTDIRSSLRTRLVLQKAD
ncbi:MAG TPA: hypothetical protein VJL58_00605 [Pyrinomonadaceae bacterium]|nr:hypothetical protein [Pyrinomonadaceae bacterium]